MIAFVNAVSLGAGGEMSPGGCFGLLVMGVIMGIIGGIMDQCDK